MRREKLDRVDVDHVDQTVRSRGWQLIRQRIERTLEQKRVELEHDAGEVATAKLRGFIEGMKLALEIPKMLMQDGKEGGKQ